MRGGAGRATGVTGYTITSIFNIVGAGVKQEDVVTLPYADLGVDVYGSALVTTERYAAQHGDAVRAFIRAGIQGLNIALSDPKAAVAAVLKHDPLLDAKVELDRLDMAIDTLILTPYIRAHGYGSVAPSTPRPTRLPRRRNCHKSTPSNFCRRAQKGCPSRTDVSDPVRPSPQQPARAPSAGPTR